MTKAGEPGGEIRAGDKVRRRDDDSGEVGTVLEVLPWSGELPFRGTPMESGAESLLFDMAVVRWGRRKTVVPVAELVTATAP